MIYNDCLLFNCNLMIFSITIIIIIFIIIFIIIIFIITTIILIIIIIIITRYGDKGMPDLGVPGSSTLIFRVTLIGLK